MATEDEKVRPQIDAVRDHLKNEGLAELHELLTKAADGLHTIRAMYDNRIRLLRLSYVWLSDHPAAAVVAYLQEKDIAAHLKTDTCVVTIHDGGMVHGELCA